MFISVSGQRQWAFIHRPLPAVFGFVDVPAPGTALIFYLWITFLKKKQSGMPFTAFCLFSGKLSPVIMTKRKSGWFAATVLFLYNKDKKEKDG